MAESFIEIDDDFRLIPLAFEEDFFYFFLVNNALFDDKELTELFRFNLKNSYKRKLGTLNSLEDTNNSVFMYGNKIVSLTESINDGNYENSKMEVIKIDEIEEIVLIAYDRSAELIYILENKKGFLGLSSSRALRAYSLKEKKLIENFQVNIAFGFSVMNIIHSGKRGCLVIYSNDEFQIQPFQIDSEIVYNNFSLFKSDRPIDKSTYSHFEMVDDFLLYTQKSGDNYVLNIIEFNFAEAEGDSLTLLQAKQPLFFTCNTETLVTYSKNNNKHLVTAYNFEGVEDNLAKIKDFEIENITDAHKVNRLLFNDKKVIVCYQDHNPVLVDLS